MNQFLCPVCIVKKRAKPLPNGSFGDDGLCENCDHFGLLTGCEVTDTNPYFAKLRAMTDEELAAELSEEGVMKWRGLVRKILNATCEDYPYLSRSPLKNSGALNAALDEASRVFHAEPDAPEGWAENPDWSAAPLQKEWPEEVVERKPEPKWPRVRDLPENERAAFWKVLEGQTMPMIEGEPMDQQDCYYPWDYERWKAGLPVID